MTRIDAERVALTAALLAVLALLLAQILYYLRPHG